MLSSISSGSHLNEKPHAFTISILLIFFIITFCFHLGGIVVLRVKDWSPFCQEVAFNRNKKKISWREGGSAAPTCLQQRYVVAVDSGGTCEDVQGGFKGVAAKHFDKSLTFCFHGESGCKMSSSGKCPCSELSNCVSL